MSALASNSTSSAKSLTLIMLINTNRDVTRCIIFTNRVVTRCVINTNQSVTRSIIDDDFVFGII